MLTHLDNGDEAIIFSAPEARYVSMRIRLSDLMWIPIVSDLLSAESSSSSTAVRSGPLIFRVRERDCARLPAISAIRSLPREEVARSREERNCVTSPRYRISVAYRYLFPQMRGSRIRDYKFIDGGNAS